MSQFTLSMFRRLAAIFGADADVGFREQGYLIMAPAEGRALLAENVALQQSMGADIALLGASDLDARFPWLASEGVAAAGLGRAGEGWFDPPSLADLFRKAAVANGATIVGDRVTGLRCTGRACGARGARRRRQRSLRAGGERRGSVGRRGGGAGGCGSAGRAAQALRLCHRRARGAGHAAPGAPHRRSVGRMVPAGGARLHLRQVAGGGPGATRRRPRRHRPRLLRGGRSGRCSPRACPPSRPSRW